MSVRISVPTVLRSKVGGEKTLEAEPGPANMILANVGSCHPGFLEAILTPAGDVRRHISLFVDDDRLSSADDLAQDVPDGARLTILTAVAGGA